MKLQDILDAMDEGRLACFIGGLAVGFALGSIFL